MVMQERAPNMVVERTVCKVPLELYTGSRVLSGQVSYHTGSRVTELLNGEVAINTDRAVKSGFIGLSDCTRLDSVDASPKEHTIYVRKSSIQMVAIADSDTGRGVGADSNHKNYPFVNKSPVEVSLDLDGYTVTGSIYCRQGQTILDVLDDERSFLPMTSVKITRRNNVECSRPFAAINKRKIESIEF